MKFWELYLIIGCIIMVTVMIALKVQGKWKFSAGDIIIPIYIVIIWPIFLAMSFGVWLGSRSKKKGEEDG